MKLDPLTKRLYTDDDVFLKQLHCPYRMSWNILEATGRDSVRLCTVCARNVTDTADLRDEDILSILKRDPAACLRVSLSQDNLRVIRSND